jgi:phosphosulfolactate phosphohydrolase-like enzyme
VEKGFGRDVAVAAELDTSTVVPVLTDGWFTPAP